MKLANSDTMTFDLTEIEAELEISNKKYIPLNPLKTGNEVEHFVLKKENINKSNSLNPYQANGSVLLKQIAYKPLAISFYSSAWQDYGLTHLRHLNTIQKEIKALGGNLLILTSDGPDTRLEELLWDNSLQLNFYFDKDNDIAQKFGLFSDLAPAWCTYPGIEVNVPLLATYVIDQSDRVIFDYVDHRLAGPVYSNQLLRAIQNSYLHVSNKQSA